MIKRLPFAISPHGFLVHGPPFKVTMIENIESENPARFQHARDFTQTLLQIRDVFNGTVIEDEIEMLVRIRQAFSGIAPIEPVVFAEPFSISEGHFIQVAARREFTRRPTQTRKQTIAATMIERRARERQCRGVFQFGHATERDARRRGIGLPQSRPEPAAGNALALMIATQ